MKAVAAIGSNAVASDRVVGFDLLRGICAISVVVYHVLSWAGTAHLYTWGTYAVYMFFVLSGASMWVAYAGRFASGFSMARFLGLRLVRLAPLYLLAMAAGLALQFRRSGFDGEAALQSLLNIAFQFGLGNPGATARVTGGWSLGIEFVFYLLFPVFLALIAGRRWWLVLLAAFVSQHVFVNLVLGNGKGFAENFTSYTQPLAFVFYFAAGCTIGRGLVSGRLRAHWLGAPLLVGSLAVLGSVSGAASEATLIGAAGVSLSLLAVLAVAASAAIPSGGLAWISEQLGKASYGVYILHPFVVGLFKGMAPAAMVGATVAVSVLLALVLERWFERPVQAYFKRPARA